MPYTPATSDALQPSSWSPGTARQAARQARRQRDGGGVCQRSGSGGRRGGTLGRAAASAAGRWGEAAGVGDGDVPRIRVSCTVYVDVCIPTWGIRIWIFLGEARKWNIIEYPRIFNDIPFIGSRIFHFEAKFEYNIVFFSSLRVFPT